MSFDFNIMRSEGFAKTIQDIKNKDYKKITKDVGWKKITKCPICGDTENFLKYKYYDIKSFVCLKCRCLWNDKIPDYSRIEDYDFGEKNIKNPLNEENYEYRKNVLFKERLDEIKSFLKNKSDIELLDIGCGNGAFLDAAKSQFNVEGVEISQRLAELTYNRINVPIHNIDFVYFVSDKKYDIITMYDFIEHTSNPSNILKKAYSLLSDGGIIVVYTPNFESLVFDALGTDSNLYNPVDHLVLLSSETIKYMINNLSTRNIVIKNVGCDIYDIMAYLRDIHNFDISVIKTIDLNSLQIALDRNKHSNHFRVILEK